MKAMKIRLENTQNGHSKWWEAVVREDPSSVSVTGEAWVVESFWGKIGLAGDKTLNRFYTKTNAVHYVEGRVKDKLRKGYVVATATDDIKTILRSVIKNNTSEVAAPPATAVPQPTMTGLWDLF